MNIEGKTVVVAGGSAGIGLGCARAFARRGAKRIIVLARRAPRLDEAVASLRRLARGEVVGLTVDLSKEDDVRRVSERILADFGVPDIICHSSGAGRLLSIEEEGAQNFRLHFESTALALFHLLRAFTPKLLERRSGHVVIAGGSPMIHLPYAALGYMASRSALHGMALALKEDFHDAGIGVTYAECGGIGRGTAYFEDNPGSRERLPLARFSLLDALYMTEDEAGEGIVAHVAAGRVVFSPPLIRCMTALSRIPWIGRALMALVLRWAARPASAGGFISGSRCGSSAVQN